MEMRRKKLSINKVREILIQKHDVRFGIGTLKKSIRKQTLVKPRNRKNGIYRYLRKLELYKAQILAQDDEGLDAAQIVLTIDKTLNKKVKEPTVASYLAFWKSTSLWRQLGTYLSLDAEEALAFLPVDWRSAKEL